MRIVKLLTLLMATSAGYAQIGLPMDFESSSVITSDFTDFDGGVATVISNPQSSGINTSATVAQIVRNGGATWSGSKITMSSTMDFSTMGAISMKVYTTAPVGTQIKLKLEGGAGDYASDAVTKTSGAWETLTWDFAGAPTDKTDLVFMFDFGFVGDGSATSTFLFDDIQQVASPSAVDLDIDFESSSTITSDFTDFDGGTATVLSNPDQTGDNTSATVGQIVRDGGQAWGGSKLILGQNLDFSTLGYISMDVYTTAPIGTPVQIKLEGSGAPTELQVLTTTTGEWETLLFDFTSNPQYLNTVVFMFDIGTVGDGSATSTFYFDNVKQTDGTTTPPTGIGELSEVGVSVAPNPATDVWTISSESGQIVSVSIVNGMGVEVASYSVSGSSVSIDASGLADGTYTAVVSTDAGITTTKLVK